MVSVLIRNDMSLSLANSFKLNVKDKIILEKSHIFSRRFEWGDLRCANCIRLIESKSTEICDCLCHFENNPFEKYHELH